MDISLERLKERLHYCPDTGVFTWKDGRKSGNPVPLGNKGNGRIVKIDGSLYSLSRLAIFYVLGFLPKAVRYVDGDHNNLKIVNLRPILHHTTSKILDVVNYDPATGEFTWKVDFFSVKKGDLISSCDKTGYLRLSYNGYRPFAHNIACLAMTGKLPPKGYEIDHINRIRDDNRWENLRVVTRSINHMNRCVEKKNKSGYRGVCKVKGCISKWKAYISVNRKQVTIGSSFDTPEEAALARDWVSLFYYGIDYPLNFEFEPFNTKELEEQGY
jgi:hypothetical protein